jgi:Uma2 family endonuclease
MVARANFKVDFRPVDEYLEFDRRAEWKYEYFNGMVWPVGEPDRLLTRGEILDFLAGKRLEAMAGGSSKHAIIGGNIFLSLGIQLRGKSCRPFNSDLKVRLTATGLYCYPAITIACAPIEIDDDELLLNPAIIFEVLSKSTAAYDRGDKWAHYQRIESLRAYVLVSQDKRHLEIYTRQDDGSWLWHSATQGTIALPFIQCQINVDDVYETVEFTDDPISRAP